MIKERDTGKIAILLKQNRHLFHISDLMLLWDIKNRTTLRQTISRYVKKDVLLKVYRGFYAVIPLRQLDPRELGSSALHSYCYLSTETVLVQHGIMFQHVDAFTFCSAKTKTIQIDTYTFKSRQLKDMHLYNTAGIVEEKNYKTATVERACADMLYFNPHFYFDAKDQIDWKKVREIQKEVGYI